MSFVLPAIIILLGILFTLYLGWHKFFGLRRRINLEMQQNVKDVHKALVLFKDELSDQLEELENIKIDRDLNKKEERIFRELRNNIDNIDEFIEKKLKKII
jgi:hypothetical protein